MRQNHDNAMFLLQVKKYYSKYLFCFVNDAFHNDALFTVSMFRIFAGELMLCINVFL